MIDHSSSSRQGNQTDHSQQAYRGIRRMLFYKELVPGQKVGLRELRERLNMSLTPIIQSLKLMEIQGFVRHEANRGYFIEPSTLTEVEEIYELREFLEPSLVPHTIKNLDNGKIQQLEKALNAHQESSQDVYLRDRLFKNAEFHLMLASLSNKPTHVRVLQNVFDLLFLKYGEAYLPIATFKSVNSAHQKIFNRVVAADVKGAQSALSKHIAIVKEQAITNFKKILEEKETKNI